MNEKDPTENKQMSDAFLASYIPSRYHNMKLTMSNCGCADAERWSQWLPDAASQFKKGGFLHMAGDGVPNIDKVFIAARALVSKGIATAVIPLPSACRMIAGAGVEWSDAVRDRHALVIPGFTGQQARLPVDEKAAYSLEWFLRRWLLSGKALLTQGATPLAGSSWWPASFLTTLSGFTIQAPQ